MYHKSTLWDSGIQIYEYNPYYKVWFGLICRGFVNKYKIFTCTTWMHVFCCKHYDLINVEMRIVGLRVLHFLFDVCKYKRQEILSHVINLYFRCSGGHSAIYLSKYFEQVPPRTDPVWYQSTILGAVRYSHRVQPSSNGVEPGVEEGEGEEVTERLILQS